MGSKRKASAGPDADDGPPALTGNAYLDAQRLEEYERQKIDRPRADVGGVKAQFKSKDKGRGKERERERASPSSETAMKPGRAKKRKAVRGWVWLDENGREVVDDDDNQAAEPSVSADASGEASSSGEAAATGGDTSADETFEIDAIIKATYERYTSYGERKIAWRYRNKWFGFSLSETKGEEPITWTSFNMDENNHAISFWKELRKRGDIRPLSEADAAQVDAEWDDLKEQVRREEEADRNGNGRDDQGQEVKMLTDAELDDRWQKLRDKIEPTYLPLGKVIVAPIRCTHKWNREALAHYKESEAEHRKTRAEMIAAGKTEEAERLMTDIYKIMAFTRECAKTVKRLDAELERLGLKPLKPKFEKEQEREEDARRRAADREKRHGQQSASAGPVHQASNAPPVSNQVNAIASLSRQTHASTSAAQELPTAARRPPSSPLEAFNSAESVKRNPRASRNPDPSSAAEPPKKRTKKKRNNAEFLREVAPPKPLRPLVVSVPKEHERQDQAQAESAAFLPMSMADIDAQSAAAQAQRPDNSGRNAHASLFGSDSGDDVAAPPPPSSPPPAEVNLIRPKTHQPKWTAVTDGAGEERVENGPAVTNKAAEKRAQPLFSAEEESVNEAQPAHSEDERYVEMILPPDSAVDVVGNHDQQRLAFSEAATSKAAKGPVLDIRSPPTPGRPIEPASVAKQAGASAPLEDHIGKADIGSARSPIEVPQSPVQTMRKSSPSVQAAKTTLDKASITADAVAATPEEQLSAGISAAGSAVRPPAASLRLVASSEQSAPIPGLGSAGTATAQAKTVKPKPTEKSASQIGNAAPASVAAGPSSATAQQQSSRAVHAAPAQAPIEVPQSSSSAQASKTGTIEQVPSVKEVKKETVAPRPAPPPATQPPAQKQKKQLSIKPKPSPAGGSNAVLARPSRWPGAAAAASTGATSSPSVGPRLAGASGATTTSLPPRTATVNQASPPPAVPLPEQKPTSRPSVASRAMTNQVPVRAATAQPPPPPPPTGAPPPPPPPSPPLAEPFAPTDAYAVPVEFLAATTQFEYGSLRECFAALMSERVCTWDPVNVQLYNYTLSSLGIKPTSVLQATIILTEQGYLPAINHHIGLRRLLSQNTRFVELTQDGYGRPVLQQLLRATGNLVTFAPLFMLKEPKLFERAIQALRYNPYWSVVIQPQVLHYVATHLHQAPCGQPGTLLTTLMEATRTRSIIVRPNVQEIDAQTIEGAVARDVLETSRDWDVLLQACSTFPRPPLPPGHIARLWKDTDAPSLELAQLTELAHLWDRADVHVYRGVYYVGADCSLILGLAPHQRATLPELGAIRQETGEKFLSLLSEPWVYA